MCLFITVTSLFRSLTKDKILCNAININIRIQDLPLFEVAQFSSLTPIVVFSSPHCLLSIAQHQCRKGRPSIS